MQNAGMDESKTGIKFVRRKSKNFRYANDHSNGRKWEGTIQPIDRIEQESKKAGLKLNIQKGDS